MSAPVRYTAAANYEYAAFNVAAASGLNPSLTQEEQYHLFQQQQQQLQQQQEEEYYYQQQQQQEYLQQEEEQYQQYHQSQLEGALFNNNNNYFYQQQAEVLRQQQLQQQQQQQQFAASLGMPLDQLQQQQNVAKNAVQEMSASADNDNGMTMRSNGGNNAEWSMSDEGRYGIPGAAGIEYQKYSELQQGTTNNNNVGNTPIEPSLMDNEDASSPTSSSSSSSSSSNASSGNGNGNNNDAKKSNIEEELNALSNDELFNILKEYDALQDKYHTVLLLPKESRREVTAGGRDGSAYVLRCLKMWYELPSDVLFSAMSLVDRFLDRMTVKPKHMACLSVAAFHLAIKQLGLKPIPAEDLVTISQCGCTAGDLERMANVIANKLGIQLGQKPITSVSFLRIYYTLFRNCAKEIGGAFFEFYQRFIKLEELENRLENLLCDVKTTVITPSVLALVLISLHLDFHIKASYTRGTPELKVVFNYILFLQQFMRIPDRVFTCGFSIVSDILSHYNGQNKQPYKQRLVWKLSTRTLRVLRPTKSFSSDLPTIEEGISNPLDDGCRSRTESLSSEEEEDWPTSPIIPIFEQC